MYKRIFCLILCLMLLSAAGCAPKGEEAVEETISLETPSASKKLACAELPPQVSHPSPENFKNMDEYQEATQLWREQNRARLTAGESAMHPKEFYRRSVQQILPAGNGNHIYSPLNFYFALSLLGEITDGNGRAQILTTLGFDNIEQLRDNVDKLWLAHYRDDGSTTLPANGLFLNQGHDYNQTTLQNAAEYHHADIFQGCMGEYNYDIEIQNWVNEKTKNLLEDQAAGIKTDKNTEAMLISSLYFEGRWENEFWKGNNEQDTFHAADRDVLTTYMRQKSDSMSYYEGDGFTAVRRKFTDGQYMYFLLPDEGRDVQSLAADETLLDPVFGALAPKTGEYEVDLSLPRFDVESSTDLIGHMKALGITDVFGSTADFTPLAKDRPLFIDRVSHNVRVMVDEEGCKAAAFTVMDLEGAGVPKEKEIIRFKLDRPFIFIIASSSNDPLFVGIVQTPEVNS